MLEVTVNNTAEAEEVKDRIREAWLTEPNPAQNVGNLALNIDDHIKIRIKDAS